MSSLPSSYKDPKIFNNQYIVKNQISSGSFGVVYLAFDKTTREEVAIKLEKYEDDMCTLDRETHILRILRGMEGVPNLYWSGFEQDYNVMVISLLGRDMAHQMKLYKRFTLKTVLQLSIQLVEIMWHVHQKGVVHRDLKPENILVGHVDSSQSYLVDYGVSKIYIEKNKHIPFKDKKSFIGTTRYASIAAHKGYEIGRKDDLESLFYVLIYFYKGKLPWQNLQNIGDKDRTDAVGDVKIACHINDLCKELPSEFIEIMVYIKSLEYAQEPNYVKIIDLIKRSAIHYKIRLDNVFEWTPKTPKSTLVQQFSSKEQVSSYKNINDPNKNDKLKSQLLVPDRNNKKQLTQSSNGGSAIGSFSSMQIKYVPSRLDNASQNQSNKDIEKKQLQKISKEQEYTPLKASNFKKEEENKSQLQDESSPVLLGQPVYSAIDAGNREPMNRRQTMETTWNVQGTEIDEFQEVSQSLSIKMQQLCTVGVQKKKQSNDLVKSMNVKNSKSPILG